MKVNDFRRHRKRFWRLVPKSETVGAKTPPYGVLCASTCCHTSIFVPICAGKRHGNKYEIICGHNRAKAAKALSYDMIRADVRYGLSDDKALKLFYDSYLNQQSFSDWNYSQKIEAVR